MLVLGAFTLATAAPRGPAAEHESGAPTLASAVIQPVVSSVNPSSGFTTGGTTVTITGAGFTGATAVTFNGIGATSFTVVSPTEITAVTPVGAAGPALVQVAIGTCISSVIGATFTYIPQIVIPTIPTVSSMSPTSGPTAGGTTVTLTGTNLAGTISVTFGGVAGSVSNSTATSITVVTPAHAAGNVPVVVTTVMGATTVTAGYTYVAEPAVTSVSPTSGPAAGGNTVTITGTGLTGATAVAFGADAATSFTVDSDTQITAVAPAHAAGTVDVEVNTPDGTATAANAYTYAAPPSVTSVSPTSGPAAGGTSVTITGSGLTGTTAVVFDGSPATSFTVNSGTSITAVTPAHAAGTVDLQVTGPGGTDVVIAAYVYVAAATATSMFPTTGPDLGGTFVTITGTGFTGATAVTFGGVNASSFVANSDTQITAMTPPGSGTVPVTVTTPNGSPSVPGGYEYLVSQAATFAAHAADKDATLEPAKPPASGKADNASGKASGTASGKADAKQANKQDAKQADKAAGKAKVKAKAKAKAKADAAAAPRMKKVFFQLPPPACPAPPSAPSPVTATAGTSSIIVSWTAATPNDSPITGYTATATPGPATCTTLVTDPNPLGCVLGATAGQQYTVSVVANSAAGASEPATSNAVTPAAPVVPAAPPDTPLTLTTDKGVISRAAPGQDIVVIGTGFAAYSTATITLYSTPVTLGTVVTDGNGDFSKPVTVPHSLAAGVHTLVAQGVAPSGNPRAMKLTVTVAASTSTGGLPVTGAPTGPLALGGLAMVLAGLGLLRPWQRRTTPGLR
ncbi:hypothetical protein GCM10007977_074890 [Dactylosporangium sucinum]|uniref:Fibronectin type-III domain-containing protein n=1 Tax=Dactylosporangium sucinum TaxID=1424081 RepID=A0A917U8C8_9ACTN|nr:hypothetical protein GCM10007977_074890 [Dactylosporangium sucinum]